MAQPTPPTEPMAPVANEKLEREALKDALLHHIYEDTDGWFLADGELMKEKKS